MMSNTYIIKGLEHWNGHIKNFHAEEKDWAWIYEFGMITKEDRDLINYFVIKGEQ